MASDGKAQRPEASAEAPLGRSEHIPTPEGQGGGEDARRSSEWLRAYAQSSFTTIEEADRLHTAANELDRLARLLSSPRVEEVRREALEEAAKVADDLRAKLSSGEITRLGKGTPEIVACNRIAEAIRALHGG